jgi:hypothetical protein
MKSNKTTEEIRLEENKLGKKNWLSWGPYLSERQWGTVREDYSAGGDAWGYLPHDHSRSRTYRWGEDGIAGISDSFQRLCFAVTLWNGNDPIIKERMFGLNGNEGNHGEDAKEIWHYLDNTPTHTYMKHLYKYPQGEFPYLHLLNENKQRSKREPEFELLDTGIFENNKYFDVFTEYAKADTEDILIKITVFNRAEEAHHLSVLPTLWFRNLWSVGIETKPEITSSGSQSVKAVHSNLGEYHLYYEDASDIWFTENETNTERIFGTPNDTPHKKDAFHIALIEHQHDWIKEKKSGTKAAPIYHFSVPGNGSVEIKLRLRKGDFIEKPFKDFKKIFESRFNEADDFYNNISTNINNPDLQNIQRQAFAGMLWSKQYFNIDIPVWLNGDKGFPAPPEERKAGRNANWSTLNNEDIISMPDKWEYPWYAAWDTAFHCVPLAMVDPEYAKSLIVLFTREWYMHTNGQLPAYEWNFSDVNPPVHAWGALQVFRIDQEKTGVPDIKFLKRVFNKLLLNFNWWVNQKDAKGNNVFEGGFLGLDNIGVFDRSSQIPGGGYLEQADGTAWMAMYALNMLDIAIELSLVDDAYEDMCTKFFEHFVLISSSLNSIASNWTSSWDEEEGFFYDVLALPNHEYIPLKVRSLVGLSTLFASLMIKKEKLDKLPNFRHGIKWFMDYKMKIEGYQVIEHTSHKGDLLLSLIPKARMEKLLHSMLNEAEFLSNGGIRSLSKTHENGYWLEILGEYFGLEYTPGESDTNLFGGNSNWRGPVWLPMNYLLISSLYEFHKYFEDDFKVEFPSNSGNWVNLKEAADLLSARIISIFTADENGQRSVNGLQPIYNSDPNFKNLITFFEYFHGDTLRGVGASHQTGWTGLIAELISRVNN